MLHDFSNGVTIIDITIEHFPNQIDAFLRERQEGNAQRVVQDLVDVVEWVLFVHNGVEEDPQSPDVLFFAAVGLTLEDFRGRIVCVVNL